jgi:hypothetical protein
MELLLINSLLIEERVIIVIKYGFFGHISLGLNNKFMFLDFFPGKRSFFQQIKTISFFFWTYEILRFPQSKISDQFSMLNF